MKRFLMICVLTVMTSGAAFADAGFSESGSRTVGGAIGSSVDNGSAIVGVVVASPLVVAGEVGKAIMTPSAARLDETSKKIGKPLPVTEQVIVPAPDQALAQRQVN